MHSHIAAVPLLISYAVVPLVIGVAFTLAEVI
jgi:hypothetical protein